MAINQRLAWSLLSLRLSIFVVMMVWTIDKFINPQHAQAVYAKFYLISGLSDTILLLIGAAELLLLLAFVLGFQKTLSYGVVLALHAVSTLSSYKQYLAPYDGANILFFAAWPMLAACLALFLLREQDVKWTLHK